MTECLKSMRMKGILAIIGMLCLFLQVWAQQPDARQILDRTAGNFEKAGGIKATFTVRSQGNTASGTIFLKGDKFVLETEGVKTWFDGHTQWSYLTSSEEVNVSEPTPEELQSLNPYALLYSYRQGYQLKTGSSTTGQKLNAYEVILTSTDPKQELQCIILYVQKDTFRPLKISMAQRGGKDVAVVTVTSYETGQTYPDRFFTFDPKEYPEAEVIDLR